MLRFSLYARGKGLATLATLYTSLILMYMITYLPKCPSAEFTCTHVKCDQNHSFSYSTEHEIAIYIVRVVLAVVVTVAMHGQFHSFLACVIYITMHAQMQHKAQQLQFNFKIHACMYG